MCFFPVYWALFHRDFGVILRWPRNPSACQTDEGDWEERCCSSFLIFTEKYRGTESTVFTSISGNCHCTLTNTFSPSTVRFECGYRQSLDYVLSFFFFLSFFFLKIFIIRPVPHFHNCRKPSQLNPNQSGLIAIYRASWELHWLLFMWIFLWSASWHEPENTGCGPEAWISPNYFFFFFS